MEFTYNLGLAIGFSCGLIIGMNLVWAIFMFMENRNAKRSNRE